MNTADVDLRTGKPYWLSKPFPRVPQTTLKNDLRTDILIVGAGITGAMAAEELAAAGWKVALIDRRGPMRGSSAASTALLQYEIDQPLTKLTRQIGSENAMRAWRRSRLGLESLSAKLTALDIRCEARRRHSLYLAGNVLDTEGLKREGEARNRIGLHNDYLSRDVLRERFGIRRNGALLGYDNISVNPVRMTAGFLRHAAERGAVIHAPVTAGEVETHAQGVLVQTAEGPLIRARYLIYAAGYEMPKSLYGRKHQLRSTYAIATRPQAESLWPEECLIWEAADPYLYLRTTAEGRVICGGGDEDFEDEEKRDALLPRKTAALERKLHAMFPQLDARADYAWCGSFGASTTGLPTIGAIPGLPNCFAIMAFGGNGITYSRIAAELLLTTLNGGTDPEADIFAF